MIVTQQKDVAIQQYSLQESSSVGSTVFDIVEAKGEFIRRKSNFLVPHRKDFYFFCLVREGGSRHWVDFVPYTL